MDSFPLAEVLAALLILGVGTALLLGFVRATRRTRREMEQARADHQDAMAAFAVAAQGRELAPDPQWAAVLGRAGELDLRITAGADLKRSTFIRYNTQLHISLGAGRFMLPPGMVSLDLDYRQPGPDLQELAGAGLSSELLAELTRVSSALHLETDRLILSARPGKGLTHRYSYGLHLLLAPEALERLWTVGQRLAEHLQLVELRTD